MSTSNASLVGMLPAAEGVQLIIDAQYNYANPLAAPLFTIVHKVSAEVKYKVARLKKASYSARPISGACDQSAFNKGNKGTTADMEFYGQLYDHSGDLCVKDFENLCNAWTNGQITIALRPGSVFAQNEVLAAIFANKLSTMKDDMARIVWFAREAGFVVNTAAGSAPFYVSALPTGASEMLGGKQNGMWAIMVANTALPAGTNTPYVDTNDGTVAGNALNPANIYQYLQRMVDAASPELRGMSKIGADAPFFVLDYSLYEAYRQYLIQNGVNTNNNLAWEFQQNAQEVLYFNGYKVYMDMDADKFDREMGAIKTSTIGGKPVYHSRNARALFTAPKNMFIGLDLETGVDNIGLIVESGTSAVRDAGKTFYKMMMSVGMGILDPLLQVVGYPSETGTFQ